MSEHEGGKKKEPGGEGAASSGDEAARIAELRHVALGSLNQIIGFAGLLQEDARDRELGAMQTDLQRIEAAGRRAIDQIKRHLGTASALHDELPALAGQPLGELTPTPTPSSASRDDLRPGALLVVDPSAGERAQLGRFLAGRGHLVRTAASDGDALALAAQHVFDLVLLDLRTPPSGGVTVLEGLRSTRDQADLPVILLTSTGDRDRVARALQLGANDHLTRPIDLVLGHARIRSQLRLKRGRDRLRELEHQLARARARVARLATSSCAALQDVGGWCATVVEEVREATGAQRLAVFATTGDGFASVAGDQGVPLPNLQQLQQLRQHPTVERRSDVLLPVRGYSGEVVGALVLAPAGVLRSEESGQLLASFSAHLGGVLEMDRLRRQLALSTERRRLSRQEMIDRGVDVLQLCPDCGRCYSHATARCTEDGARLTPTPRPLPFRIDGRYRLTRWLGKGGMGTVFRARDEQLARDVAIKILQARFFGDERMSLRFEAEARALARISHTGVIGVHDVGLLEDGSRYIVMELLVGCTLKALIRAHGQATPRQVASLLRQGSAALQAAHAVGVIHRDIKPDNVFVVASPDGLRFKLLDFGIAKEPSLNADLTRTGDLVGTPRYMAPEQLVGGAMDGRTDLYSFAAVAYEALVGRPLVGASDLARVLLETFRRTPPPVSMALPHAPAEVDRAFGRAFARRPDRRPDRVDDWVDSFVSQLEAMQTTTAGWPDDIAVALARAEVETQIDHQGPALLDRTADTADLRALKQQAG